MALQYLDKGETYQTGPQAQYRYGIKGENN